MSRGKLRLLFLLVVIGICFIIVELPVSGDEPDSWFGYKVGDEYFFTDFLSETLDMPDTHLIEETTSSCQIYIEEIAYTLGPYFWWIRLLARVQDITLDWQQYNQIYEMDAFTPIVSGPGVFFTHINWEMHVTDFLASAEEYQTATHMSGRVRYNINSRSFSWNFSQDISTEASRIDIDLDGLYDPYTVISIYSASFTETGVLLAREFTTIHDFPDKARYVRLHLISQKTNEPVPVLSPAPTIISVIVLATIVLLVLTVFWYRRNPLIESTKRR